MNAAKSLRVSTLLAIAGLLAACGGGNSHTGSVSQLPPSIRYPPTSGLVVGARMTALTPSISSDVTDFSVSPALPPGLTISAQTGTIAGTPTAVAPRTTYTVEGVSKGERVVTTIVLTVADVIPHLSYAQSTWNFVQDEPIQCITPTLGGGTVVDWSVDRPLPAGLQLDTGNGQICGTPTTPTPQANYLVTAGNSGGTSSATLTIAVQAMSGSGGATLRQGKSALGMDSTGHALLWNSSTGVVLASFDGVLDPYGRATCALGGAHCRGFLALSGNTAVVSTGDRLNVLDGTSGARRAQIDAPAPLRWWRLAADGSYVAAATDTRLIIWSPAGDVLFSRPGDYGAARVFAAADELRIGAGAAGPNVIETVGVPTGIVGTSAPFQGSFQSWSDDGEGFLAEAGDSVREYARDPAPAASTTGEPGAPASRWQPVRQCSATGCRDLPAPLH